MIDKKIGNHLIQSVIGEGGMGVVYKSIDQCSGELRAIKFLRKIHHQETKRFLQEANIGKRLLHPNIVQTFEIGKLKDHAEFSYFMIMEYVDGESLKKKTNLSPFRIVEICLEICKGLSFIHNANIIHRDLKPSNILISQEGQVKLSDLGVVKFCEETQFTKTGAILGTPAYMSPEQCRDSSRVDGRSDIYSLGVMIFEMFANQLPFPGPSDYNFIVQHSFETPPLLRSLTPNLPPLLYTMVNKMIEKVPGKRYQSVDEVAMILQKISSHILDADVQLSTKPKVKDEHASITTNVQLQSKSTTKTPGILQRIFPGLLGRKNQKNSQQTRKSFFTSGTSQKTAKTHDQILVEGSFQDQLRSIIGKTTPLPKISGRIKKETGQTEQKKRAKEQVITQSKITIDKTKDRDKKNEQIIIEGKGSPGKTSRIDKEKQHKKKN